MKAIYFGDKHAKQYEGDAAHVGNGLYRFTTLAGDNFLVSFMELSFIESHTGK